MLMKSNQNLHIAAQVEQKMVASEIYIYIYISLYIYGRFYSGGSCRKWHILQFLLLFTPFLKNYL